MDSNPICHFSSQIMKCSFLYYANFWWSAGLSSNLSPKKVKCSFLYYVQLLMISWDGLVLSRHGNAYFWITFNFWWSAVMVDGLTPRATPLNQKNEMLIFGLHSTSDDWPGWSLDSNPIHLLSQAKKNEMLIFGLRLTSDDQPGWLMNLNPICHPSPAKKWSAHFWIMLNFWWSAGLVNGLKPHVPPLSRHKMKSLFLDYIQLLMIGCDCGWTQTLCAIPLKQKKWNAHFLLCSTSDDQLGWSMDSNPIHHPSPGIKWNVHFWIMFNFWWSTSDDMLIFGLRSSSDDQLGWSMDSNPIHHPSPVK